MKLIYLLELSNKSGFSVRVGGSIKGSTRRIFKENYSLLSTLHSVETRKIVLGFNSFINEKEVLDLALEFEKELIIYRKQINDYRISEDLMRLVDLENRK
jgi:hypothetical protein